MKKKNFQNIFLILVFFIIILLPTLDNLFNFSTVKQLFEKRQLAPRPKFPHSATDLKNYPKDFENFFNDNYGFRKTFISLNNQMLDQIFDESPDMRAVIGKDGWFFFDNYNSLLDVQGKVKLSNELLKKVDHFYKNWQNLQKEKIDYLLVIAADKSTVYPEFLPKYLKPSSLDNHRADQFISALKRKYPDFPLLDLRGVLKKAKEKEIIFHKTDTHWNSRGTHYAYVEIMNILAKNYPEIKPHLRKDFISKDDHLIRGDISDIMGIDTRNRDYYLVPKFQTSFYEKKPSLQETKQFHIPLFYQNKNKNLPIAFIYKDSFFDNLINFTSEHFSYSYYINEFPCDINYETIKKYHPNIVIQQFWEGRIEWVLKQCK